MKRKLLVILIICGAFLQASAEDAINNILLKIKTNNTTIKTSVSNLDAQIKDLQASKSFDDPNVDVEHLWSSSNLIGNKTNVSLSQSFDFPSVYTKRGKLISSKIESLNAAHDESTFNILLQAKELCINIIYVKSKLSYLENQNKILSELYDKYYSGYQHGQYSLLDVNKIKLSLLNIKTEKELLSNELITISNQLETLNNGEDLTEYLSSLNTYPIYPLYNETELIQYIKDNDPEILTLRKLERVSDNDVKMAKAGWIPKFNLGYKYAKEDGYNFNGFTIGMSLPFFSNRGKMATAYANKLYAETNIDNTITQKTLQIKSLYRESEILKKSLQEFNLSIDSDTYRENINKALNGGEMSVIQYLEEIQFCTQSYMQHLEMEYNYNLKLMQLYKVQLFN